MNALLTYVWSLLGLSLVAVGGATAVLPELHGVSVTQHHWLTSPEFARLFAIAQAAPGPNVLIVAVIGYRLAGVGGAIVSLLAMVGPSSILAYFASRAWMRFERTRPRIVLAAVLSPLAVGLVAGSGIAVARTIDPTPLGIGLVVLATALAWRTKLSPVILLALGALAGATGLV